MIYLQLLCSLAYVRTEKQRRRQQQQQWKSLSDKCVRSTTWSLSSIRPCEGSSPWLNLLSMRDYTPYTKHSKLLLFFHSCIGLRSLLGASYVKLIQDSRLDHISLWVIITSIYYSYAKREKQIYYLNHQWYFSTS